VTTASVETISFARGVPAPECLPVDELADCARTALETAGRTILSYGPGGGYAPLRAWIAEQHGVEPERVLLSNGSRRASSSSPSGSRPVSDVVEDPSYDRPLKILRRLGAETRRRPHGRRTSTGRARGRVARRGSRGLPRPTFQNPSEAYALTERRRRVVELAAFYNLRIVEDDPYGLVRYEGAPEPSLFELTGRTSIYSSSFSKTISPGLRVGWYILPEELAAELTEDAASTYITPVLLNQAIAHEFIRRGNFEPNLVRINGLLKARRDAMLAALDTHLSGCTWTHPQGGYFIWLEFPEGTLAKAVLEQAQGVTFVPGVDCGGKPNTARLAFSFVSPEEIELGVERIAPAL
jgi:DNA-binding transcriptional MocR family regulator